MVIYIIVYRKKEQRVSRRVRARAREREIEKERKDVLVKMEKNRKGIETTYGKWCQPSVLRIWAGRRGKRGTAESWASSVFIKLFTYTWVGDQSECSGSRKSSRPLLGLFLGGRTIHWEAICQWLVHWESSDWILNHRMTWLCEGVTFP